MSTIPGTAAADFAPTPAPAGPPWPPTAPAGRRRRAENERSLRRRAWWVSGLLGEQVPLRGALLALVGAPAPEHHCEPGAGYLAFHLLGGQPVDVEFDAEAGTAAPAPDLAVTGLERGHQIASRLDHTGKLAKCGRPVGRGEVHQGVPADHSRQ